MINNAAASHPSIYLSKDNSALFKSQNVTHMDFRNSAA